MDRVDLVLSWSSHTLDVEDVTCRVRVQFLVQSRPKILTILRLLGYDSDLGCKVNPLGPSRFRVTCVCGIRKNMSHQDYSLNRTGEKRSLTTRVLFGRFTCRVLLQFPEHLVAAVATGFVVPGRVRVVCPEPDGRKPKDWLFRYPTRYICTTSGTSSCRRSLLACLDTQSRKHILLFRLHVETLHALPRPGTTEAAVLLAVYENSCAGGTFVL